MVSLSVIIPNYNHAQYLGDALAAILTQSRPADEVIVIDDASTDNSRAVISEFARQYANVRPIFNKTNLGVVANLNIGLGEATGDFVSFNAADDRILPGYFEAVMREAARHPDIGVIATDPVWMNDKTGEKWVTPLPVPAETVLLPETLVHLLRRHRFGIASHSAILNRKAGLAAGGFCEDLRWHCDWFLNFVIAFRCGMTRIAEGLSVYRSLPQSYSLAGRQRNQQEAVIMSLAGALENPTYADVREAFVKSAVLAEVGLGLLHLSFGDARIRRLLTPRTVLRVVRRSAQGFVSVFVPDALKQLAKRKL